MTTQIPKVLPIKWRGSLNPKSAVPFLWRAQDGPVSPLTGQAVTFVRNGSLAIADSLGVTGLVPYGIPAGEAVDLNGDGIRERMALRIDRAAGNLLAYSEDLSQAGTWVPTQTPTILATTDLPGVRLALLADNDGTNAELLTQTTGSLSVLTHALSFYIAKGTSSAASGTRIRLAQAGTPKISVDVTWSGTVLSLGGVTGTVVGTEYMGRFYVPGYGSIDVYRAMVYGSVTSAVAHDLSITPAITGSQQGNVWVGGFQLETNTVIPTAYIKTLGTGANRNDADQWYVPMQVETARLPLTLVLHLLQVGAPAGGGTYAALTDSSLNNPTFSIRDTTSTYEAHHHNGTTNVVSIAAAAPVHGDEVWLRAVIKADGSVYLGQQIGSGVEAVAATSAALMPGAQWGAALANTRLYLSHSNWQNPRRLLDAGLFYGEVSLATIKEYCS